MHFKDTQNKLHWLDDPQFVYLLPQGSVEITDEEAVILNLPAPLTVAERKAAKQSEINALEANAYMRRGQRESWLYNATKEYTSLGGNHDLAYAGNPEYKRVFDENTTATKLRAEMKAIV